MIKKILKGILLWVTMLLIVLFISSVDNILSYGFGMFLAWISLCLSLASICFSTLTFNEFYALSGAKLIDKLTKF